MSEDRSDAEAMFPDVSRETWGRLQVFADLLVKWQKVINLVGPKTLDDLWVRHIADGLQIADLVPEGARTVVDLGSGGGFPGLVIAAALADRAGFAVHLIESDQRKCGFLREAARGMGVPVKVHNARIETALADWPHGADAVTARALAPLDKLFGLASPLLKAGTVGIFPKGQDVDSELTRALESWTVSYDLVPSRTQTDARLVVVSALTPR